MLEGRDCKNCLASRYDPNTSTYFKQVEQVLKSIEYGSFYHFYAKEV